MVYIPKLGNITRDESGATSLLAGNTQFVSAPITGTNTQADITITAVDWSNTLALFTGCSNTNNYSSCSYFTQTSSTNIRMFRNSSTSVTSNFGVSIIPFKTGVMESIQYGTVTIANGASTGTATITSLSAIARAEVAFLGQTTSNSSTDNLAELDLTDATTVTATRRGTTGTTTVGFVVFQVSATYFVARNRFTILDHANSTPFVANTGDSTAHPSSSIPVFRGFRMNGAGTYYSKEMFPASQRQIISRRLNSTITSDDTQYKVSLIQLSSGLKTFYANTLMSASSVDTTIPSVENYLRCGASYLGSGGASGGNADDYLDAHRASLTTNTNIQTSGPATNSAELATAILQF